MQPDLAGPGVQYTGVGDPVDLKGDLHALSAVLLLSALHGDVGAAGAGERDGLGGAAGPARGDSCSGSAVSPPV